MFHKFYSFYPMTPKMHQNMPGQINKVHLPINGVCPGALFTKFNDGERGGSDRGSYFIPKKITTSEFVYPKKSLLFSIPQKFPYVLFSKPQKIPLCFSRPKKVPASFIDPKKSLLAEISDPKKSLGQSDSPVIKICEWGPWGHFCCLVWFSGVLNWERFLRDRWCRLWSIQADFDCSQSLCTAASHQTERDLKWFLQSTMRYPGSRWGAVGKSIW